MCLSLSLTQECLYFYGRPNCQAFFIALLALKKINMAVGLGCFLRGIAEPYYWWEPPLIASFVQ
jgi:hypothetical protein